MSETVANVIASLRRRIPTITPDDALEYINRVHEDLSAMLPLRQDTEDVSLTDGTREYSLDEDIVQIWDAEYRTSATEGHQMKQTSVPDLVLDRAAWRLAVDGKPFEYYIWGNTTGKVVGFFPTPETTTTSGYPIVRLYVSRRNTLTLSDSLPQTILNKQVYVEGAAWYYCADFKPDMESFYDRRYQEHKIRLKRFYYSQMPFHSPSIRANISWGSLR